MEEQLPSDWASLDGMRVGTREEKSQHRLTSDEFPDIPASLRQTVLPRGEAFREKTHTAMESRLHEEKQQLVRTHHILQRHIMQVPQAATLAVTEEILAEVPTAVHRVVTAVAEMEADAAGATSSQYLRNERINVRVHDRLSSHAHGVLHAGGRGAAHDGLHENGCVSHHVCGREYVCHVLHE